MSAKKNLLLRVVSGVCLGAIAIWGVVWSNFVLNLLLAAGAIIGGIEWTQIIEPSFRRAQSAPGIHNSASTGILHGFRARFTCDGLTGVILSLALFILFVIGTRTHAPEYLPELLGGSVLTFISLSLWERVFGDKAERVRGSANLGPSPDALRAPSSPTGRGIMLIALGFPVIGSTILSLLALHQGINWHALIFLLSCVSATDIGAFAFGKTIGGRKLAPRISPNKTWAGSIGGLATAGVIAAILSHWLGEGSTLNSIAVGVIVSVLAQAGDLLESALKRRFSVKDSGFLIPGHGGILDRIDGLLLAAPLFTLYRLWLGGPL